MTTFWLLAVVCFQLHPGEVDLLINRIYCLLVWLAGELMWARPGMIFEVGE